MSLFRSVTLSQTGDGNTVSESGAFLSTELVASEANNYNSVTMTPGAGSPVGLPQANFFSYAYQTGLYGSQAAMDADFPTGTYTFDATSDMGTDTASFDYTGDDYPQSSPYLTGTDYSDLQGINPTASFDADFSTFTTGAQADESYIFFTVYDDTDSDIAFSADFLSPSTSGVTIPANTLDPGHNFTYELIFSNRDFVTATGAEADALLAFDLRTSGTFSTVPESASAVCITVLAAILGRIAYWLRKRSSTGVDLR